MSLAEHNNGANHFKAADLLISLGGAATSFGVITLCLLISRLTSLDLLSLSFWFVIPAGALLGGMGAASGYYAAAKWTHTMPSRRLLIDMVIVGGTSWLSYHLLDWYTYTLDDGTRVKDVVPFGQFFAIQAEHMRLAVSIRGSSIGTGELGVLGFLREGIQFLGFLAGGFVTYGILTDTETCDSCRKYTKNATLQSAASPEQFDGFLERAEMSLPGIGTQAEAALGGRQLVGLDLVLRRCPQCEVESLRPALVVPSDNAVVRVKLGVWNATQEQAARLRAAAAEAANDDKSGKSQGWWLWRKRS